MSKLIYDVIQRFEVENGVPRLLSTNIQVIQGGEDLLSLATNLLAKLGFYDKFEENRTSQYIGYRLKNPKKGLKRYQLVLAQRKDLLYISIPKNILKPYVMELQFSRQFDSFGNVIDDENNKLESILFWVRPNKKDVFIKLSGDYNEIYCDQIVGTFNLDPFVKGLDLRLEEIYPIGNRKVKFLGNGTYYYSHNEYFYILGENKCCLSIDNDSLFPYAWQVCISSKEILEEFIGYFTSILIGE
ncbi:MAG TPA: hypothetical protein V6D15_13705 [Oculatellaceae cyanobacterium]|jgi:hypothetical protein